MISTTESKPSDSATANARTRLPRRRRCRTWKANPSTKAIPSSISFESVPANSSCYSNSWTRRPQPPGVYSRTFSRSSLGKFVSHVLLRTVGKSASRRTPSPISLRIRQANAGSRRSGRQKRLVLQGRPRKGRHHGVPRRSPDFSCNDSLPETAEYVKTTYVTPIWA